MPKFSIKQNFNLLGGKCFMKWDLIKRNFPSSVCKGLPTISTDTIAIFCIVKRVLTSVKQSNHTKLARVLQTNTTNCLVIKGTIWNFVWILKYKMNKRPLDSYACPDQSKRNRTNQQIFFAGKKIFKTGLILRKRELRVGAFSHFWPKRLLLFFISMPSK